jgi:hypothetical protein
VKINSLTKIVSAPRLQSYLRTQAMDQERTIKLYRQNITLSRSFYPLLSILEVAIRNVLDTECIALFADPDWLQHQKTGFMSDPRLTYKTSSGRVKQNEFLRKSVQDAEWKIQKRGKAITHGRIVSELTFGFWTELFERTHYRLLKGVPIKAFPNLPATTKRVDIYNALNDIRRFRNRVYHNEPVCFYNGMCDVSDAIRIRESILELLRWMSNDIVPWSDKFEDSTLELAMTHQYSANGKSARLFINRFFVKLNYSFRTLIR